MQSMWDCATRHIAIWQTGSTDTCECRIDIQRNGYIYVYIIIVADDPIEFEMWTREVPENWITIEHRTFI